MDDRETLKEMVERLGKTEDILMMLSDIYAEKTDDHDNPENMALTAEILSTAAEALKIVWEENGTI